MATMCLRVATKKDKDKFYMHTHLHYLHLIPKTFIHIQLMHLSINMYVPVPHQHRHSRMQIAKKCCFTFCEIEDDQTKQLKEDCCRHFKIGFKLFKKRGNRNETNVPRFSCHFNPRDLQFDPNFLVLSTSLSLSPSLISSLCTFFFSFFSDVFGHIEIQYFIYSSRYRFTVCFLYLLIFAFSTFEFLIHATKLRKNSMQVTK